MKNYIPGIDCNNIDSNRLPGKNVMKRTFRLDEYHGAGSTNTENYGFFGICNLYNKITASFLQNRPRQTSSKI